jgi:hypothetical protein
VKVLHAVAPPIRKERQNGHLQVWVIRCASTAKAPSHSGVKNCLGLAPANSLHHFLRPSVLKMIWLVLQP